MHFQGCCGVPGEHYSDDSGQTRSRGRPRINTRHNARSGVWWEVEKYYVPSDWLAARGFTKETLDRYGVGLYSNPARKSAYTGKVMIPILRYDDGVKVGYLARTPETKEGEAKYVFAKGFAKHLEVFGAYQLKEERPIRVLYVVESPFAAMKFSQHGFAAVSCLGWSVSPEQSAILAHLARGCIYLPDADKRSEGLAQALPILGQRLWVKSPALPAGVDDPENLSAGQIRALS